MSHAAPGTATDAASDPALAAVVVRDAGTPSPVAGVTVRALRVNRDPRGTLTELLRADWPDVFGGALPFAQVYASTTAPGIARDEETWHVHAHQSDRFCCLAGVIAVAIADPRPDSPTNGAVMVVRLAASADAPAPLVVTIPPGTLHGFVVVSPTPAILLNAPTRLYDATDEGRVPFAGVALPDGTPFSFARLRALNLGAPDGA